MTGNEYIEALKIRKTDINKADEIEKKYNTPLPELVRKMVTEEEPVFLQDQRVLCYSEILYAEEDLGVQFTDKKIIPLIDCGENDFIVYHYDQEEWSMFNIVDETMFFEHSTLDKLLK